MTIPYTYTLSRFADGTRYSGMTTADLDGNGLPEILIGNRDTQAIDFWQYVPASSTFGYMSSISGLPYSPHDVAVADVNGDGAADVLISVRAYGVYLALNNGDGTFAPLSHIDGTYSDQVLVRDFDGDGHLDIFDGIDQGFAKMFYGAGNGTFTAGATPAQVLPGSPGIGYTAIDVNNDGLLDLVGDQSNGSSSQFTVYLNQSTPGTPAWSGNVAGVSPIAAYILGGIGPTAGDFNGDGFVDWVGTSRGQDTTLYQYVGGQDAEGKLTWTLHILDSFSGSAYQAMVGDVNDDGHLDILLAGGSLANHINGLRIYLGDGTGAFTVQNITLDHSLGDLNAVVLADVNGDGRTDIVAAGAAGPNTPDWEVLLAADRPPAATADTLAVNENAITTNLWAVLLGNDSDPDPGDTLGISAVDSTGTLGTLAFDAATKTLTYSADADVFDLLATGATTTDSFHYTVTDASGLTSTALVTVTITGVADGIHISAGNGGRSLLGTDGEDTILGGNGRDTLSGGRGADELHGGNGDDLLLGGAGIDFLYGDNGSDRLDGGAGNDVLDGGAGNNTLTGGDGHDSFLHGSRAGSEVVTDFTVGTDHLVLIEGVVLQRLTTADVNGDGVADSVLFLSHGSIALLGVSGVAADSLFA